MQCIGVFLCPSLMEIPPSLMLHRASDGCSTITSSTIGFTAPNNIVTTGSLDFPCLTDHHGYTMQGRITLPAHLRDAANC